MDILQYPSCKLYDNGKFRLPNQIRRELQNRRVHRVVMIAAKPGRLLLLPVSKWERNKKFYNDNYAVNYPVRPQPIAGTFLSLNSQLSDFLGKTENLYFEADGDFHTIWNEKFYKEENDANQKFLEKLYYRY
jgi:hypothetical protein